MQVTLKARWPRLVMTSSHGIKLICPDNWSNGATAMPDLSLIRTLLFTPADRPERFAHGAGSGADGAVLDLEDGVGLPAKATAREAALDFFRSPASMSGSFVWALRLNHVTSAAGL